MISAIIVASVEHAGKTDRFARRDRSGAVPVGGGNIVVQDPQSFYSTVSKSRLRDAKRSTRGSGCFERGIHTVGWDSERWIINPLNAACCAAVSGRDDDRLYCFQLRVALENIYVMGAVPARPTMEARRSIIAFEDTKGKPRRSFAISTVEDIESEEDASKATESQSVESLLTIDTPNGHSPQFIV